MTAGPPNSEYKIVEKQTCYKGFFSLNLYRVRPRLYSGGWSEIIEREVFERGHAAGVLLYDSSLDRVVLVEQFRVAAIGATGGAWVIEVAAGIIDAGETPETVVRREAVEESGLTVTEMVPIGEFLMTPGGCTETFWLYCGRVDASQAGGIFGHTDEGEDIRVVVMDTADALEAVVDGRIRVANAVLALQWLGLNRVQLRKDWLYGE
jgi:ADP-ribose pyrophosphatase